MAVISRVWGTPSVLAAVLGLVGAGCSFSVDVEGSAPVGELPSPGPGQGGGGSDDPDPNPDPDPVPDPKPTSGPGILVAHKIASPPDVLDEFHTAEEWQSADDTWFDMADAASLIEDGEYSPSALARVAAFHTESDIYLLVAVDDAEVRDGDAIELFIDGAGDAQGPYGVDDHDLLVGPYGDGVTHYNEYAADIDYEGTIMPLKGRYILELRIAKDSIGAETMPQALGFNLALVDDDPNGFGYGLWHMSAGPYCEDCCEDDEVGPWCDTTTLGQLVLLDE